MIERNMVLNLNWERTLSSKRDSILYSLVIMGSDTSLPLRLGILRRAVVSPETGNTIVFLIRAYSSLPSMNLRKKQ